MGRGMEVQGEMGFAETLDRDNDSILAFPKGATPVNLTASGQILSGPGTLLGIEIISHSAGATVRVSDALTATTPYLSSAITTVAGHLAGQRLLQFPTALATGGYITISGTIEIIAWVIPD